MCLVLGGLAGLFAATFTSPAPVQARFTPPREVAFDFRLHDQDGRPARLADARGKVIVLTWIYTSCRDLCPAEGAIISDALRRVGGDRAVAYAVSVDPVGDTPARARDWLERRRFDAADGRYLLGTRDELRPVWLHYGIAPIDATPAEAQAAAAGADAFRAANPPDAPAPAFHYQKPPGRPPAAAADEQYPDTDDLRYRGRIRHIAGWDFEHSGYVLLIDKRGEQRVGIPFEQLSAESLAHDVRALLAER
jgi:cytochrome oxidase Cu insertion factor (SCO1/SenC/PrrC family)